MAAPHPISDLDVVVSNGNGDKNYTPVSTSTNIQEGAEESPTPEREPPAKDNNVKSDDSTVKPSLLSRALSSLGFTPTVFMIMFKPAVAATIAMAIYQSQDVAKQYYNFGYLTIIISITTVPILPRGKFLANLVVTLFLTCFAAAMVLLGQYAGIQARDNTTPPDQIGLGGYNSSASVVNAIFLIINLYMISVLRASRPIFAIPAIQYVVFIMVGFTYGAIEPTVAKSQVLVQELLYAFLTGQGISTAVALLIIPVSSRKVFFAETTGFFKLCRGLLKTQLEFVQVLQHSKLYQSNRPDTAAGVDDNATDRMAEYHNKAAALKKLTYSFLALATTMREDVVFAEREVSIGNMRETDIRDLHAFMEDIMYPIAGVSTIADISKRMNERYANESSEGAEFSQLERDVEQREWEKLMTALSGTLEKVVNILDESIVHILLLLKLIPGPKEGKGIDVNGEAEKGSTPPKAGDAGFGDYLENQITGFRDTRSEEIRKWAEERGYDSIFQSTSKQAMHSPEHHQSHDPKASARDVLASRRLHIVLYMEYLLYSVARAILALVRFAELKTSDGSWAKTRFIFPAWKTLVRWVQGIFNGDEANNEESFDQVANNAQTVYVGDSFGQQKDPEHLPPKNWFQAWGDHLRIIPRFLGSSPSRFGVRVCIAVMSLGITAYLESTQTFFVKQRVLWAMVMTAVGMSPTTGSAVFSLFWSLTMTLFGMVGAFLNWYAAGENTAAVIVLFFLTIQIYFYFAARFPRFLISIVAGALTHVLAIGYELQVRVIGLRVATATGQPFYPIYELAPYRLLSVGAGLIVAYIFTIFPVPISESSVLRQNLGKAVMLLAKHMNATTATVNFALKREEGEAMKKLAEIRKGLLMKEVRCINSMRTNISFLGWEPRVGGDFPRRVYEELVEEVQNITNYLTIIAYATHSFPSSHSLSPWLASFAASRSASNTEAHQVTSLLALLSSCILNGQPLPPYLRTPKTYSLSDEFNNHTASFTSPLSSSQASTSTNIPLNPTNDPINPTNPITDPNTNMTNKAAEQVGKEPTVLALRNVNEPGFRAIAVIEVAQQCLVSSVARVVVLVRELVGEMDFTFEVRVGGEGVGGKEKNA